MPDAGGCPNCTRPLAAHERVCTSCGYSRDAMGVVQTRVRPRSMGDVALHALRSAATHPATLAAAVCAAAILLAAASAGDPKSIRVYSVLTGLVCIAGVVLQAKFWWIDASLRSAADIHFFGWVAVVFAKDAPPMLRIITLLGVTMAAATGWLQADIHGPGGASFPDR